MALKRILTSQVELGMYIHGFQGNWLSHPFWRAHFIVDDDDRLRILRNSKLDAVIIDTDRGADVAAKQLEVPASARPDSPMRPPLSTVIRSRSYAATAPRARPVSNGAAFRSGPVPVAREFGNARRTADKARKVISKIFLEARHGNAPRVSEVAPVVEDIHASIQRNPYAFSGLMRCKAEHEVIYQHMLSVSALMVSLARQMKMSPNETRLAGTAGLLLDIGASGIGVDLNAIGGRIDRIDPSVWHQHTTVGRDLLEAAGDVPEEVLRVAMRHHERINGSGFPQALTGNDIDIFSRMAAICDTYDHIVSGALDEGSVDPAEAMHRLMQMKEGFDSEVLARFVEALGVYPVGSFVLLRSGRIAMVIDQNPSEPATPTVRAFYSLAAQRRIGSKTIVLSNCYGEDGITGIADLEGLGLPSPEDLREEILTGKSGAREAQEP
jgi:HD-GYP domain-containing protein (c-di-GMP phosphodiesterase class II)